MSIQNFYTAAQAVDFHRIFQFRLLSFGNIDFDKELVYVETAQLPGIAINNIPVSYMGLQFNVPGTISYPGSDNYAVTFRCDGSLNVRSSLESAILATFDPKTTTGKYSIPNAGVRLSMALLGKGKTPNEEIDDDVVKIYELIGAYVKSVEAAAYDVKDTGTVQTISCSLAYQYWLATNPKSTPTDQSQFTIENRLQPAVPGVFK